LSRSVEVFVEQRKRESVIPKGAFGGAQSGESTLRGDLSGTFIRPTSELPENAIARVELRRTAPPPPPAEALLRSTAPHAILPPPMRAPGSTPSLYALVASTYPTSTVPALQLEDESERVEFPDFAGRLDVPHMAPAPSSLLPLPGEERPRSLGWIAIAASVVVLATAGWLLRGSLWTTPSSPPTSAVVVHTRVAPLVAVEPVAVEPVAVEPVAVEPVAVEPVAVEPVAVEPVASVHHVAERLSVRRVSPAASVVDGQASVDSASAAAEPGPSLEAALVEELPETLERSEVIEGIEMLRNEYEACAADLHGVADLMLTVLNTGRISHAVVGGKFAGTPQGSCLARTLRQARFRSFLQPRIEIAYPLSL
jgi:hypothetical protein